MKLVPMRFKGVEWHHNPRKISFECDKRINELKSPDGSVHIQNTERKNAVISGEGELYGTDCFEQFNNLLRLFCLGGAGVLCIAKTQSVFAVFESLEIIGEPKPDVIAYSFVFREISDEKKGFRVCSYTAENGEDLWDISHKFNISIDTLVSLNDDIKRPDEVPEGTEVKLC